MKTWKIRELAFVACLVFMTTAYESKNDGAAGRRPTTMVALTETDGRGSADSGGVSYGVDDAVSEMAYKSEACGSDRHDTSNNERSDRKSDKKSEPGRKDKSGKRYESEKEGKLEQKDKLHEKGEPDKRESGKAGSGSSERSASHNYYFDDDNDEIVTPDGAFVDGNDPVIVVKTRDGVAYISSGGEIARVEGDVKKIDIYRSDVDVIADSTAKVRILGSDVGVFVRSVSSAHFDGSNSDVCQTGGPMPSIIDNGAESEIRQARSAPARQPQTADAHCHQVTIVLVELIHASQQL